MGRMPTAPAQAEACTNPATERAYVWGRLLSLSLVPAGDSVPRDLMGLSTSGGPLCMSCLAGRTQPASAPSTPSGSSGAALVTLLTPTGSAHDLMAA
jgi:hypothetical protein